MAAADEAILSKGDVLAEAGEAAGQTQWIEGSRVSVTTLTGEVIDGEVYALHTVPGDKESGTMVLRLPNTSKATMPSVFDYRMVNIKFIRSVKLTGKAQGRPMDKPSYIDINEMNHRKIKAVKAAKKEINKIGVGVTREAQTLFDLLSRTMDCKWVGDAIEVYDMVLIKKPYTEADCSVDASIGKPLALDQVRAVVRDWIKSTS